MQVLETFSPALRGRMSPIAQNSRQSLASVQARGVSRWVLYKQLCVAKSEFALNDRCLAVLSSLLSFLPDDELSEKSGLIVFPSNRQLSLRAHGMPESTLRRHLASLIEVGIITRKDSPTRKRYAHKNDDGEVDLAFGFSFAPLIQRASEIAKAAERILAASNALKQLRDEVSVIRRDIAARFAEAASDDTPFELNSLFTQFRSMVDGIPRRASADILSAVKAQLEAIQQKMDKLLKNNGNAPELSVNAAQNERQYIESLPESLLESKKQKSNDLNVHFPQMHLTSSNDRATPKPVPLSLETVLRCCPDIRAYATKGIACWRDLLDATRVVSSFLGIADAAYREAAVVLGREGVSAVVAWILQRSNVIESPGGYLRSLTQKARAEAFALTTLFTQSPLSGRCPA